MATIPGSDQPDALVGGAEGDLLQGIEGADTLDGAEGIDTLEGGTGDDTYIVGETRRTVDGVNHYYRDLTVENADEGVDTVIWMGLGGYMMEENVENGVAGTRYGGGIIGNDLDNRITGWDGTNDGNWLRGGGGNDTITGGDWDDDIQGDEGNDLLIGYLGENTLAYTLDSDVLDGGAGADTMMGGDGYDTYWADDLGDVIVELAVPEGLDEIDAYYYSYDSVYWTGQGAYVMPIDVDIMHLQGGSNEALGNEQANVFYVDYGSYTTLGGLVGDGVARIDAAGGDDILLGGTGADTLIGGEGSDQIQGADGGDELHGGLGDDAMRGDAQAYFSVSNDTLFGDEGDDLLEGDNGNDSLDGGDGIDVLIGSWGNDTLTGGAGADRFSGSPESDVITDFTDGEDLILANFANASITQDGADTVITMPGSFGWDDGTLRLIGVDAALITADDFLSYASGSEYDDSLTGDDGDEFLAGGDGDDAIDNGGGDDAGTGGAGEDTMDGGDGEDTLNGGTGDDTMDGGDGEDTLSGGSGDDSESGDHGDDEIDGGYGEDTLYGGFDDDTIDGGEGEDWLYGGEGEDWLEGGSGDDTYIITDIFDDITEYDDGGYDVVESDVDWTLDYWLEDLYLGDAASQDGQRAFSESQGSLIEPMGADARLDGHGNALANRITGSSGANLLAGAAGNDLLLGRDGDDLLIGGKGFDRLNGGAGDDRLTGGFGADRLTGGIGADGFVFKEASGADRITDFSATEGDRIHISSSAASRFKDLAITADGSGGAIVSWAENSITIDDVAPEALRARHFVFTAPGGSEAAPMSAFAASGAEDGHRAPIGLDINAIAPLDSIAQIA